MRFLKNCTSPFLRFAFFSFCCLLSLSGCTLGYLTNLGLGQLQVITQQVDVEEVLQNPAFSETYKERIRIVLKVKQFSEEKIGFIPNKNYTTFYDTQGKPVSYNICACEPDSFDAKTWWFPIVGTIPYLGFFELAPALKQGKILKAEGYDVILSEVGGYSTLGWFTDPIFSAMLEKRSIPSLIDLIIHESTHAHVYLAGESDFNETLANFVAEKGTELFFATYPNQELLETYHQEKNEKRIFNDFVQNIYEQLKEVYEDELLSKPEKLKWKKRILTTAAKDYKWLQRVFFKTDKYPKDFPADKINNAYFAIFKTYHKDIHVFEKIYLAHHKDLKQTVAFIKTFEKSADPFEEMKRWIEEHS